MKFLLDTQLLLWSAGQPRRLTRAARALIAAPEHELMFSAASIWEIAIKCSLGRDDFRAEPGVLRRALVDNGYAELPVTGAHAARVLELPMLHKDPFDRMLLAQALVEGVTLLTGDKLLERYGGPVRVV
ncbi:MAG: type II toxin-antitoxin system VapC family toxin [Gemmatimonadaceae bacterium]|nr:type II toxin-antitoxin system VapC family toxin [Gemmatimonadaceae bacterium]MCW5825910.1 type II toxin-antitoxin system VapC family toxin [Gemmatimonadaceae bacterium]